MEIDTWLAGISDRMNAIQRKSAELTENMAAASGVARSPDGAVTVEVGANGGLHKIEFTEKIEGRTPTQIGELVMRTARAAQRAASEKVAEALSDFGGDGELMKRYVSYQPPLEPDELRELEIDPEAPNAEFGMAAEEGEDTAGQTAAPAPAAAPAAATAGAPPTPVATPPPARRHQPVLVDDADDEDNDPW